MTLSLRGSEKGDSRDHRELFGYQQADSSKMKALSKRTSAHCSAQTCSSHVLDQI